MSRAGRVLLTLSNDKIYFGTRVSKRLSSKTEKPNNNDDLTHLALRTFYRSASDSSKQKNHEAFLITSTLTRKINVEIGEVSYLFMCFQR